MKSACLYQMLSKNRGELMTLDQTGRKCEDDPAVIFDVKIDNPGAFADTNESGLDTR